MSTLKVNNLQVGQDGTAANNYTLYQPASPDGTLKLGIGVAGNVTSNILSFNDNGSRLRINTITGSTGLNVVGADTNGFSDVEITAVGTSGSSRLYFSDTAGKAGSIIYNHSNDSLGFTTSSGSTDITVDNVGRLLIGRTTVLASSSERFAIDSGMAIIRNNSTNTAPLYLRNEDSTADTRHPYLTLFDGSGNRGGIGIQNDESSMWIHGQTGIAFRTSGSTPGTIEILRMSSTGNVGIGTTNPTSKLVVYGEGSGNGTYSSAAVVIGKTTGPKLQATQESADNDVQGLALFVHPSTTNADAPEERFRFHSSGKFLVSTGSYGMSATINKSAVNSHQEAGDFRISGKNGPALTAGSYGSSNSANAYSGLALAMEYPKIGLYAISEGTSFGQGDFAICINGTADSSMATLSDEKFRIKKNGNVGIGTNNPAQRLDVRGGNISFDNKLYTDTISGNTGDTRTLTLPNISEGASYIFTLTRSSSLGNVNVYQALIIFNGNGNYQSTSDIVNTAPTNLTITVNNASGGTATITLVNGGVQRFKATVLRVN